MGVDRRTAFEEAFDDLAAVAGERLVDASGAWTEPIVSLLGERGFDVESAVVAVQHRSPTEQNLFWLGLLVGHQMWRLEGLGVSDGK